MTANKTTTTPTGRSHSSLEHGSYSAKRFRTKLQNEEAARQRAKDIAFLERYGTGAVPMAQALEKPRSAGKALAQADFAETERRVLSHMEAQRRLLAREGQK